MSGFRVFIVILPVGFLLTLFFWIVDAARLVRWALLVASANETEDARPPDGEDASRDTSRRGH